MKRNIFVKKEVSPYKPLNYDFALSIT